MIQLFYIFSDWAMLAIRLALALILIAHGWPKIKDLETTAKNFAGMGFTPGRLWGMLAAIAELFGGLLILIGFFTQIAALILAAQFIVIMIWRLKTKQKLIGGYELDLIILATLLVLAASNGGALALDSYFRIYLF